MRTSVASSKWRATSCMPIGRPDFVNPQGTETPGRPVRGSDVVHRPTLGTPSAAYGLSSRLNAAIGVVG